MLSKVIRKQSIMGLCLIICLFRISVINSEINDIVEINSIDAEKITSNENGDLIFSGSVEVKTNFLELSSNKAVYNEEKEILNLYGNISISSSGTKVEGEKMIANFSNQLFSATDARYTLNKGASGIASNITLNADGNIKLEGATYINCNISDPFWEISAKEINLLKNQKNAIIKGISLKIKGKKVFSLPILRTAIGNERMTGFLAPDLKKSSKGLDISMPYYFNLAKNFDLTLTPRLIQERGNGISNDFRYLKTHSKGNIFFSGILDDKKFEEDTGRSQDRWIVKWQHESQFLDSLSGKINLNKVSDIYYFKDIGNDQYGEDKTTYLKKEAEIKWKNKYAQLLIGFKDYQNLNPFSQKELRSYPRVELSVDRKIENFYYSMHTLLNKYEANSRKILGREFNKLDRTFISNSIQYKKENTFSSSFIKIGFDYLNHKSSFANKSENLKWLTLESKIFFDKKTESSFMSISPLLRYVYSEESNNPFLTRIDSAILPLSYSNLLNGNVYSGYDGRSGADNIILGLEHSSIKRNSFAKLVIGKAFYLDNNPYSFIEKRKENSPLIIEYSLSSDKKFSSYGSLEWDNKSKKVNSAFLALSYSKKNSYRAEVRSIFRRDQNYMIEQDSSKLIIPKKQLEGILEMPIGKSWKLFSRWQKDLKDNKSLDMIYGLKFSSCCLRIGIMKRRWAEIDYIYQPEHFLLNEFNFIRSNSVIKPKDSLFITIELLGLGRVGRNFMKAISSSRL
ncbi:MAG: LPS assembly protein LptD [SAR86 cluster bacterium]|jgi:LPS-assembly protein|nr:LPS assembly protein LptD [SAR86 cluster bacterium]